MQKKRHFFYGDISVTINSSEQIILDAKISLIRFRQPLYSFSQQTQVDAGEGLHEYMKTELRWSNSEPTSNDEDPLATKGFKLAPAFPNPFNPATNIQYTIEQAGEVSIKVYDLLGREVAELIDGRQAAGSYTIKFNAEGLSSGIYYGRMSAGNFTATRSISLVK